MRKTAPVPRAVTSGCIAPALGVFMIAGLFVAGSAVYAALQCVHARWTWTKRPATITQSSCEERSSGSKGGTSYGMQVRYRYFYQGRAYSGDSIGVRSSHMTDSFPSEGMAQAWISDHSVGASAEAFVNPANPRESALETDLNLTESISFFFGIPFIAVGYASMSGFFPWSRRPLRKGIIGYVALTWGALALFLHLMAGSVSLIAWIIFAGYFYVVLRMMWETFHPKPKRGR